MIKATAHLCVRTHFLLFHFININDNKVSTMPRFLQGSDATL